MPAATAETTAIEVRVPDIGDFPDVAIIEVHVHAGDVVDVGDRLITLESDKATIDIPSPGAGLVSDLLVRMGDRVSEGTPILLLEPAGGPPPPQPEPVPEPVPEPGPPMPQPGANGLHAGPSVRRLARELGIDLSTMSGSGPRGRVLKDDLLAHVRAPAAAPGSEATANGTGIPPIRMPDFTRFGPTETVPLSRIRRLSGAQLHASWLNIPHVTHADEADITDLEAYRRELDEAARADGHRITLLAFLLKASVSALSRFPEVNSSLSAGGESLILKRYHNLGVAVDTADGLVVPVIRDVDRKGITELSRELGALSEKARDGRLTPTDLSGANFTVSSLGGIGGTHFTPIINAPEVAILGVARARMAPVWDGDDFRPRLMLPMSLSYDHRVIDGALAARFLRHLCRLLDDVRRLVL